MVDIEVYTPAGVLAGTTDRPPRDETGPDDGRADLAVDAARWYPVDGSEASRRGDVRVSSDDALLVVADAPRLEVHLNWYEITLELGPYRVSGLLGTQPGFDPGRALARPGGVFIALRDAVIELVGRDDAGVAEREHVLVNRYSVERVQSTLMLGHFFPGARLVVPETVPVA